MKILDPPLQCSVCPQKGKMCVLDLRDLLTHSERRPPNIYSQEELHLFCVIKLATYFFFYYKSIKLDVLGRQNKYEHLAILSNLKSCQFAPRIVIFNPCICCQFEDSHII